MDNEITIMKKSIGNITYLPTRKLFPMKVELKAVASINFSFPNGGFEPEINVIYEDQFTSSYTTQSSMTPDEEKLQDLEAFKRLVTEECQIKKDEHRNIYKLWGDGKSLDSRLQAAALLIYCGRKWAAWTSKMQAMFATAEPDDAKDQADYLYSWIISKLYEGAMGKMMILGEKLPADITAEQKLNWGKLMLYAQSKLLAISISQGNQNIIRADKSFEKQVDALLYKNGLGHLIPYYKPEPPEEDAITTLFNGTQELIWSAWKSTYNAAC
jgi:hypothetical protein